MMDTEKWLPFKRYEGFYEISNHGRVRSIDRVVQVWDRRLKLHRTLRVAGKLLKPATNKQGYHLIRIVKNGKMKRNFFIHRILMEVFCPNDYKEGMQVNHINGIKDDNHISNLEWVTPSQNVIHSFANGLQVSLKGSQQATSKLTEKDIPEIFRLRKSGLKLHEISARYGVTFNLISMILLRKCWTHVDPQQ